MPRRAAVVIHGIGQQQPYEMARAFADGLLRIAQRNDVPAVVEQIIPRMQPGTQVPPGRVYRVISSGDINTFVDVYEAYWAPLTTGMTSFLGIVWWLLINTFIPSRLIKRPLDKTVYDVAFTSCFLTVAAVFYYWLFGALLLTTQEVLDYLGSKSPPLHTMRLSFDLGGSVAASVQSFGHLLWGSWTAPARIELGKASLNSLGHVLSPVTLGWLLATAVGVYALFQFIFRLVEFASDPQRSQRLLAHVAILAISGVVYLLARNFVTSEFFAFGYIYVVFRLANLWLKKYFVDYIGDIEVYVSRDSKSARFTGREEIRSRAVDAIKAALMSAEDYAEVLVFGHSLGSVIGLDALRELRRQAGRTMLTDEQFDRLVSFVTFGSPLEKTRFFFDRISPDDQDRWRDFLDEIQKAFQQDAETRRIYWTNFWYFADVIANSLKSYNGDRMPDLVQPYLLPRPGARLWVHSEYVVDDQFLQPVYRRLFGAPPPQQFPAYVMGRPETIVVR